MPPILLLLFNRPHHTRALLELLRPLQPERLYVHIDGPRPDREGEAEQVQESRRLVSEMIDWPCAVQSLYREKNAGLRAGVSGAIDWFFELETAGIILEDDVRPNADFFSYCKILLEKYADDERVMHIGGLNLAQAQTGSWPYSYFASRFVFVWGWATWRRAWKRMNLGLRGLDEFIEAGGLHAFLPTDRLAQRYILEKFRETRDRRNQSWAYAWFFSVLQQEGLCLTPRVNLVENAGVGEEAATHTTDAHRRFLVQTRPLAFPLVHPKELEVQIGIDQALFYVSQKPRTRLWLWALRRLFR